MKLNYTLKKHSDNIKEANKQHWLVNHSHERAHTHTRTHILYTHACTHMHIHIRSVFLFDNSEHMMHKKKNVLRQAENVL